MLKEIDLVAFGRRVHIYNAIKELRQRSHTRPMSMVSPSMSGYEPDSPGNMSFASPGAMSFASPSMPYPQSNSGGSHNDDLHGLGLDDQDSSRPASSVRDCPDRRNGPCTDATSTRAARKKRKRRTHTTALQVHARRRQSERPYRCHPCCYWCCSRCSRCRSNGLSLVSQSHLNRRR